MDKHPDEIMGMIQAAISNDEGDYDDRPLREIWEGIDELVDDIMSSVKIAIVCSLEEALGTQHRHSIDAIADDVQTTVYDYYGNHYDLCAEPCEAGDKGDERGAAPT